MNRPDEYLPLFTDYFPPVVYVPPPAANLKLAARLRKLAEGMQKQVDAKRNPAIGNQNYTARRKRIERELAGKRGYIQHKALEAATDEILQLILRPGDKVMVPWSDNGVVVRVNQKSVTVKTGTLQECVPWGQVGLHNWRELVEERLKD